MSDFDLPIDNMALERMGYPRFAMAHTVRRASQAPNKVDVYSGLQLPTQSVLHTLNGFDTLHSVDEGMPDPNIPLVTNEQSPVWLYIHTNMADEHGIPFGVKENYIYRRNTLMAGVSHFYQHHKQFRRIMSDRTIPTLQGVLTWVDYSPLNAAKVNGTLGVYRKFDILFRTILDKVIEIGNGRHHYILLPQSNMVFGKPQLMRSFKELTTGSLNGFLKDPSIFPIIHLMGYIFGKTNNVNVTPYKEDVLLGSGNSEPRSTSLLERIPLENLDSINFVLQRDDRAVIYNLGDLTRFSEDTGFFTKFYRHVMGLRMHGAVIPEHVDTDSDQFDTLVEDISGDSSVSKTLTTTELIAEKPVTALTSQTQDISETVSESDLPREDSFVPVLDDGVHSDILSGKGFEEKIRTTVEHKTAVDKSLDRKAVSKRQQLVETHLNTVMNGKPLGEWLQAPSTQAIAPKQMNFLTHVPEDSFKENSLVTIDRTYLDHGYAHEMSKVIGSLAKHGLYATKIEEDTSITEMDRLVTYKVSLTDDQGKAHHVKYTLPHVNQDGMMLLSGTEYRLTRQIANVPICKVSNYRVNLSSYYNKIIVERVQSKRTSYEQDISKLLMSLKALGVIDAVAGGGNLPDKSEPYDYTAIGRNFSEVGFRELRIYFETGGADEKYFPFTDQARRNTLISRYGTFVGTGPDNSLLFWNMDNHITQIDSNDVEMRSWPSFHHLLLDKLGNDAKPPKTPSEWTQARIINQNIPIVIILGYKFGLKRVLDFINLKYKFYPTGTRPTTELMDISVKFADGTLVFNRYPLSRSLVANGLNWVNLKNINFSEMNIPDIYGRVLNLKGMSVGVLKGLNGFFDFFVDPITESVLEKMGEPITFHELLLRANVMLTEYTATESSSVALHRFRLYERFNGAIYNEIYRELNNYRNNVSKRKGFSINPEAIFQKIVQDATVSPNDVINPVHEVKQRANFTFTGSGGRSGNSFVLKDRIYPKDGLGVISESVPDSGKVGITSYLSASPKIKDYHGIPEPHLEGTDLTPPQILSIGSMVMPGGTVDDGKRNNYLSIQISHYVPNHDDGETLAVRTGYDEVLPHLSSKLFASAAQEDGIVESIDEKQKVLTVRYQEKVIPTLRSLTLPYLDSVLSQYRDTQQTIAFLIPDQEINLYPMGGVFSLTKTVNGKIIDRLRCDTLDAIPDKDIVRRYNHLIQDFVRGRYSALYYIRLSLSGIKTAGELKRFSYKDEYSPVSGAYLLQTRKPNVAVGDRFKQGDILIYNPGFFVPNPLSKQVTFKHGVIATVALVEKSSNHEDACEISQDLSRRLKMTPCHQREIITKYDAAILKIVKKGDHVETSDSLCIISDEYLVQSSLEIDAENIDIMEKLNRQTPSAGYTGVISKVRILYGCDRDKLSESLKAILKTYEKEVWDNFRALNTDPKARLPEKPGWVAPGTKYKGVDFTRETVLLEFMIQEELDVVEGDKICFGLALKSIVSHVSEEQHYTESGIPVDALFSTTGVLGRIVASPFLIGAGERVMDKLKSNILDMYFDE